MSSQNFTFPPPPPAPPAASQNHPIYGPRGGGQNGHGARGHRGQRGNRGHGRGPREGGAGGGGYNGSPHANSGNGSYPLAGNNASFAANPGYNPQVNEHKSGGYPFSNHPPVQLPQYPPNLGQEYLQSPSNFAASTPLPQPSNSGYIGNPHSATYQHDRQQQLNSSRYGHPAQNSHHAQYPPQTSAPYQARPSGDGNQPALMGPPIRMGFEQQREDHQIQPYLQPPIVNTANPYRKGTYNHTRPPYPLKSLTKGQSRRHDSPKTFPGYSDRGQKRRHGDAFEKPRNQGPRPQAPPAVPSFGAPLPLPVKPPVAQDGIRNTRKKKKRRRNQLGLTPQREEHESNEEEDDTDEEARLAAVVAASESGSQVIQFESRGQTCTLQSSADIAAWIEERKRRFPTKARVAEATEQRRKRQEAQRAANNERKETQERRQAEAKERQKKKLEEERKQKQIKSQEDSDDDAAAAKAKRKVEKLRKQLEKEERRAAKAEVKASKSRREDGTGQGGVSAAGGISQQLSNGNIFHGAGPGKGNTLKPEQLLPTNICNDTAPKVERVAEANQISNETAVHGYTSKSSQGKAEEVISTILDPLTPTSQSRAPSEDREASPLVLEADSAILERGLLNGPAHAEGHKPAVVRIDNHSENCGLSTSDATSDTCSTDSEDLTSTSGSSSSDSLSGDDAPDRTSSKRSGPMRVAPPRRVKPKTICRDFLRSGHCGRGDNCKYRHELPERGSRDARNREVTKVEKRTERVRLYHRLVEQEKEKEDHEILKAIIHLGENGLLDRGVHTDGAEQ